VSSSEFSFKKVQLTEGLILGRVFNNIIFLLTAFSTLVLSFLTFFTGIGKTHSTRGMVGLLVAFSIQGFLIFRFIASFLKSKRESKEASVKVKKVKAVTAPAKKDRKKESDLPEADQNVSNKKVKTK
jgi:translocating chain-associated membrane protein 1